MIQPVQCVAFHRRFRAFLTLALTTMERRGSKDNVVLRRAVLGDEDILRDLRLQALSDAPEAFGSTLDRELARSAADWRGWLSPGAVFILEEHAVAKGIVAGVHISPDACAVHLMSMWVHPTLRGTGAADALVGAVLDWARHEGVEAVHLYIVHGNFRAQRFYERQGFRLTDQKIVRARDGLVELKMECRIDELTQTSQ
jgi:GNAT superfamily N-acetyltransferase